MKSKKTVYILLVLVVLIWTMILVRFFTLRKSHNYNNIISTKQYEMGVDTFSSRLKYELILDYDDPFLKELNKKNITKTFTRTDTLNSNRKESVSTKTLPPKIIFNGIIKNISHNKKVGLFNIDNIQYFLKEGDSCKNITVISIWKDSVYASIKNQTLKIERQDRDN